MAKIKGILIIVLVIFALAVIGSMGNDSESSESGKYSWDLALHHSTKKDQEYYVFDYDTNTYAHFFKSNDYYTSGEFRGGDDWIILAMEDGSWAKTHFSKKKDSWIEADNDGNEVGLWSYGESNAYGAGQMLRSREGDLELD